MCSPGRGDVDAHQSRFNPKPAATTVTISHRLSRGGECGQRLDTALVFGPAGKIDASGAGAVLCLENGVSKARVVVGHRFLAPGSHCAAVEFTLSNGSCMAGTRTLLIE
jgi:hypothetical protein